MQSETPEETNQQLIWLQDADLKSKLHSHGQQAKKRFATLLLSFQTLGVVYGDIGTSPLYVYASVFPQGAPDDDKKLLGAFCMIFWTLTLVIFIKYVAIMLRADDNGEGGLISLYTIIKRAADIPTPTDLHGKLDDHFDEFNASSPVRKINASARFFIHNLHTKLWQQTCLLIVVLLGVNMIISDGVLTPAISVVSAIEGIEYNTTMTKTGVVGISIAVLIILFSIQQFGTEKVSILFSPVIFLWFLTNAIIGLYNLIVFNPGVVKGLSPQYLYYFWSGGSSTAWRQLGSVMLSITGGEALYADLGHFNAKSIQLSFIAVVYPSLAITYLGQTSYIMQNRASASSAYWASTPKIVYIPVIILATLAAIIASQALIAGAFSIMKQGISIKCFPRFTIKHTSETHFGQIYIPEVNWSLMVGCIIIVAAFQTSTRIGNAYGLAICTVMVIDTFLLSAVMLIAWNWNILIVVLFLAIYSLISFAYLSSSILKIPEGAWFSIVLSGILSIISYVYWWGQSIKVKYIRKHMVKLSDVLEELNDEKLGDTTVDGHATSNTRDGDGDDNRLPFSPFSSCKNIYPGIKPIRLVGTKLPVARLPGLGLYYSELINGVPPFFLRYLSLNPAIHECVIVVTIRSVPLPALPDDERLLIRKLDLEGFYHVVARYGYMETINQGGEFARIVVDEVLEYLECHATDLIYDDNAAGTNNNDGGENVPDTEDFFFDVERGTGNETSIVITAASKGLPTMPPSSSSSKHSNIIGDAGDDTLPYASSVTEKSLHDRVKSLMRSKSTPVSKNKDGGGNDEGKSMKTMDTRQNPELMVSYARRQIVGKQSRIRWESTGDDSKETPATTTAASPKKSPPQGLRRSVTSSAILDPMKSTNIDMTKVGASRTVSIDRYRAQRSLAGPSSFPWVRQPSKINRTLSKLSEGSISWRDAYLKRMSSSRTGYDGSVYDATASVPLPPPPQRPCIHRRAGSETIPEGIAMVSSSILDEAVVAGGGDGGMMLGSTVVGRSAEILKERLQEEREKVLKNNDALAAEKGLILQAYSHGIVHLIGTADLKASSKEKKSFQGFFKRFLINSMYALLSSNSRPAAADYNIPIETLLETRTRYEV